MKIYRLSLRLRLTLPALALSVLLAACGDSSTESMLASAKDYIAKKDNKAAVIQIKNALQKTPNSGEARFLLGTVLLGTGEVGAAEVELRKALEFKYSTDLVVPPLMQSMLAQGQFKKATDEFAKTVLATPRANAELQTNLAAAYAGQGKSDLFKTALNAALAAEPDYAPALLSLARQKAGTNDFDGAMQTTDAVLAKAPTNPDAWKLKGDILYYGKSMPVEALAAFRKVLEIKPDSLPAHAAIMTVLLAKPDMDEAAKQMEQLKKIAPNHPQTKFLSAQMAYQKRDFKAAREFSQDVLRVMPGNPKVQQLAGAIEFQMGSMLQAEGLLSRALQVAPELPLARRMLIMTYLRSGQPAKALTTLTPILGNSDSSPEVNSLAGEVFLQNGDAAKAEQYFSKASKLDPKDARKRTSLAMVHMIGGKEDSAFGELQEIANSDEGVTADLALISANLRRRDYDKALAAIAGLEKKQPNKPLAANLRGKTLLAKKDLVGGRKSFENALAIDPTYFPAVASLAALDMAEKKPEDAKKRFESVLQKDPKNGQALLALAEISARSGAPKEEVAKLITKAVDANPSDVAPRLLLIDYYLRNKEEKQALSVAQSASATLPESPELLDALGRVQQAAGDLNQAAASFNKLAGMQPASPAPLMRLADVQLASKNKDGAAQSLRKSLELKPDLLDAQRGLILLSLDQKKYAEAVTIAQTVQKQRPKEPTGFVLEGDVAAAQKKWDVATEVYRAGLKAVPSPELAIKLHAALLANGKGSEAEKVGEQWMKDRPADAAFQFYLGDVAIAKKDYAAAERQYTGVVRTQPNNAIAYNNLAWVAAKLNKTGAIGFAETANKLAPNQPAFMDTLAVLLSDANQPAKAIELQKRVLELQPDAPIFKLNMAKIQIKAGDKTGAKASLDDLTKLGDKFGGQAEVDALRKSL